MKRNLLYGALGAVIFAATALGRFAPIPQVPMDRLIANTTAYIKEFPEDPMGPYTLARIHYLAFVTRAAEFGGREQAARLPVLDDRFGRIVSPPRGGPPNTMTEEQLRRHLTASVENYRKALSMDAKNPLFHLGLASVSEAVLTTSGLSPGPIPGDPAPAAGADLVALWREQAIAEYLKAYELSVDADIAIPQRPIQGLASLMSYESGQRYVAMVNARGPRPAEAETLRKVQATLQTLDSKPRGPITPIIFSLTHAAPLADLLDEHRTVAFNLDGTGRPQKYSWVRPDTGILVWDPEQTGTIRSGHQLFGSVTFNMFWSDGYRAMDSLDDNRDGALSGKELTGLAIWRDRNQDGASQPGEVVSIEQMGIASLSVKPVGRDGASPMNQSGLTTTEGRTLPTYDWTTEPIQSIEGKRLKPIS